MTQRDVEAILGVPPGIYNSTAKEPWVLGLPQNVTCKSWVGDGDGVLVFFDRAGKVWKTEQIRVEKEMNLGRKLRYWVDLFFDK
jgi:hypothetical protein